MELGQYGWNRQVKIFQQHAVFLERPTPLTAAYGLLNLGSAPFDGLSSGAFAGSASGTKLAINASSGYAGNLADWQVAGASRFTVDAQGVITNTVNSSSSGQATIISQNTNSAGKAQFEALNDVGVYMSVGVFGSTIPLGLANVASIAASAGLVLMSDGSVTNGTDPITFRVGGYDTSNEQMRLTSTGNLLLGTTTPIAASGVGIAVQASAGQTTDLQQWQAGAATVARVDAAGNITATTLTSAKLRGTEALDVASRFL